MLGLIGGNFALVLERERDVIEPFEQTVPREFVDLKTAAESQIILYSQLFKIDGELVIRDFRSPACDLGSFSLTQGNRKQAIFGAVGGEDIRERGRNDGAEAKIRERPNRMFA